jgi:hypothetical protein
VKLETEVAAYAKFVDGKWVPISTMSTGAEKMVMIGGNSPMPHYLYAALVTRLDLYMKRETVLLNFPYAWWLRESKNLGQE